MSKTACVAFLRRIIPGNHSVKIFFLFLTGICIQTATWGFQGSPGQNGGHVSGTVLDGTGQPIQNVSVTVKGGNKGTTTDAGGNFSIKAGRGDVLVFSFVGYITKETKVGSQVSINVTLLKGDAAMDEVVVAGYGSAVKVRNAAGTITVIQAKDIEEKASPDMFDALQGKVPGLMILNSSGEPSSQVSLSLNGIGSLSTDVTPLILLDGMPVAPATALALSPNDIESMVVLRDASATSIYGARAANGVINIVSKKGRADHPTITLQSQYGISELADKKFFRQFMSSKQLTDFWVATDYASQGYVDTLLQQYPNNTEWYKYYYKNHAPYYQENLSLSGGSGKTTYYISGSFLNSQGEAFRSNYKRYTLRANLTSTITSWLNFGLNLSGGYQDFETNPSGGNSTNRGLYFLAPPFYSPIDPATGKEYPYEIPGWAHYNPQYRANELPNPLSVVQLNPMGFMEFTPIKGLTIRSQAALDAYDYLNTNVQLPSFLQSPADGSVSQTYYRSVSQDINNTAEYKFKITDKHSFSVLAGQEYIDNKYSGFSGSSSGQTDDRLIQLQNGPNTIAANSGSSEYNYISYFGTFGYTFNEKYSLNLSARQDESSLFGADKRTGRFGSIGVVWQAKKETFLTDVDWLSDLQVRINTGTSGNSSINTGDNSVAGNNTVTANYQSQALVGTSQYNGQTGWNINSPGNPILTWEQKRQTTLSTEIGLFNRANIDLMLYDNVSTHMLVSVPYPYTSGFSSITANVGALQNKGFNATIRYDVLKTKKATITPYVTLSYNQQKVTRLFQGLDHWIIPNTGVCWAVGKPVSYFYPIFYQIDPQTGNPQWYQPNSDPNKIASTQKDKGQVTTEFNSDDLQQNTGIKEYPPFFGGWGLDANYGGLSLNVNFSFVSGKYIINNDQYFYDNPNVFSGENQSQQILNYWKKPGDVAKFPQQDIQFTQFDSRLIQNASFIRMKNITLAYSAPSGFLQQTKVIKSIKFYLTGRNLLTFTKYTGVDPEVNSNLELGGYPNTKQLIAGLDVTF